jgi:hypothetical protein
LNEAVAKFKKVAKKIKEPDQLFFILPLIKCLCELAKQSLKDSRLFSLVARFDKLQRGEQRKWMKETALRAPPLKL